MAAHVAAGNRAEALQAYQRLRSVLADELGVDPGPETESAYLDLLGPRPSPRSAPADEVEGLPPWDEAFVLDMVERVNRWIRIDRVNPEVFAILVADIAGSLIERGAQPARIREEATRLIGSAVDRSASEDVGGLGITIALDGDSDDVAETVLRHAWELIGHLGYAPNVDARTE